MDSKACIVSKGSLSKASRVLKDALLEKATKNSFYLGAGHLAQLSGGGKDDKYQPLLDFGVKKI